MAKRRRTSEDPEDPTTSPTVLTLRVYHQKTTFTADFNTRFATKTAPEKKLCSCSRLPQIWFGANPQYNALSETPTKTTVVYFVFKSTRKTETAQDLCKSAQKVPNSTGFRKHVHKLMTNLATICEADHGSSSSTLDADPAVTSSLKPFQTKDIDVKAASKGVRNKISTPLAPREAEAHGLGYVYIMRSQSNPITLPVLKIGFSKYHPEHRAHELAQCLPLPEVVGHTPLIPHAMRVESLIHTELVAERKVLVCGQCGRDHREWFTISHVAAREVVMRWSRWILQKPYRDGVLFESWRVYLESLDFDSLDPKKSMREVWQKILRDYRSSSASPNVAKEMGAYLNACYFEQMGRTLLGPPDNIDFAAFTAFSAAIQDFKEKRNHGDPFDIQFYLDSMDRSLSSMAQPGQTEVVNRPSKKDETGSADGNEAKSVLPDRELLKLLEQLRTIRNLKTGAMSVSDPSASESPLGDATLLPVLTLNELGYLDAPALNWIGYSPTHTGFQLLQEAYQKGEWMGTTPRFQLPEAFRRAGVTKLSDLDDSEADDLEPTDPPEVHASSSKVDKQATAQDHSHEQSNNSKAKNDKKGARFRFKRTDEGDTYQDSYEINMPLDDDLTKRFLEHCMIEKSKPGGGGIIKDKETLSFLRQFGLAHQNAHEDEGASSVGGEGLMDNGPKGSLWSPSSVSRTSAKSTEETSRNGKTASVKGEALSKAAKKWLASI